MLVKVKNLYIITGIILTLGLGNSSMAGSYVLAYALFDPNVLHLNDNSTNEYDLQALLDCEYVTWIVVSGLAHNFISIEQVLINDHEKKLQSHSSCGSSSSFAIYRASLTSIPYKNTTFCDISNGSSEEYCHVTTDVAYSSYLTTKLTSMKKKDRKTMLIEEGSIVGGITFLTYFLGVFVLWTIC